MANVKDTLHVHSNSVLKVVLCVLSQPGIKAKVRQMKISIIAYNMATSNTRCEEPREPILYKELDNKLGHEFRYST